MVLLPSSLKLVHISFSSTIPTITASALCALLICLKCARTLSATPSLSTPHPHQMFEVQFWFCTQGVLFKKTIGNSKNIENQKPSFIIITFIAWNILMQCGGLWIPRYPSTLWNVKLRIWRRWDISVNFLKSWILGFEGFNEVCEKGWGVHWPGCLQSFRLPPFIVSILEVEKQTPEQQSFRKVLTSSENANFDASQFRLEWDHRWFFWIKSMQTPPNTLSKLFNLFYSKNLLHVTENRQIAL